MVPEHSFAGTLAVIGGGRMGEAILGGLLAAGVLRADQVVIAEPVEARREALAAQYGVRTTGDSNAAAKAGDVVLLAVKPQVFDKVLTSIAADIEAALLVSIAAGVTCARMESLLPAGAAVVRVMPNTPALVRSGMSVVSGGTEATPEQVELVRSLFSAVGRAIVIEEQYQDAATAVSGSGPAYIALVIDAMTRGGVAEGLSRDIAQELAVQTCRGTAELIECTGQHPEAIIDAVSSPGGTTIAAVGELEAGGVRAAFANAVSAAVRRAKELGR